MKNEIWIIVQIKDTLKMRNYNGDDVHAFSLSVHMGSEILDLE